MKIDVFTHIITPGYRRRVLELLHARGDRSAADYERMMSLDPTLTDLDARFRLMDQLGEDYRQVLVMGHTSAEHEPPDAARELARIGNQELAETVARHPDRFVGWVAQTALQDGERGLEAIEQAIGGGALGVPGRVEQHHGCGDDQAVDHHRVQAADHARLAMGGHHVYGMPVGDQGRDRGDGEHRGDRGPPGKAVAVHRASPEGRAGGSPLTHDAYGSGCRRS